MSVAMMAHRRSRPVAGLTLVACAAWLLAACSQPAREAKMAVPAPPAPTAEPNTPLHRAVAVAEVAGGRPTSGVWRPQVDNPELARAIERSLQSSAMLALNDPAPRYLVGVRLLELHQPWFGFDMTSTARVTYRVVDRASGALVYEDDVTSSSTAPFSSTAFGPERVRRATEGAIRENIRAFLERFAAHRPAQGGDPRPLAAMHSADIARRR